MRPAAVAVLMFVAGPLCLPVAGRRADVSGTFPSPAIARRMGVQASYTATNVTIAGSDRNEGAYLRGTFGPGLIRFSGTVVAQDGLMGVDVRAYVYAGGQRNEARGTITAAGGAREWRFDISVNVPGDATSAGSSLDLGREVSAHLQANLNRPPPSAPPVLSINPPADEVACTVSVDSGTLEIRYRGTEEWTPVQSNARVRIGDSVRFRDQGRASLIFPRGHVFRIKSRTELTLGNERVSLRTGGGNFTYLPHVGTTFILETPISAIGVYGTVFSVAVADGGQTTVKVFEGTVRATAAATQESTTLTAGQTVAITAAGIGPRGAFDAAAEQAQWDRDIPLPDSPTPSPSTPAPGAAFPAAGDFNGMVVNYSISGASATSVNDPPVDFTWARKITGALGSGQLRVSGTARSRGIPDYPTDVHVRVWAGETIREFTGRIAGDPGIDPRPQFPLAFDVGVDIPASATSGGFRIVLTGRFSAGSRGLIVEGTFKRP